MEAGKYVKLDIEKPIAIVTVDNPPANSVGAPVVKELYGCLDEIYENSDVKVVIITGAGEKFFLGGGDIKLFPNVMKGTSELGRQMSENVHKLHNRISSFPKPVISAINGMCLGGGFELALACDFRVCTPKVKIGLPEIKLGLFPGGGGTQRLSRMIGYSKALELMLTGENINAEQALALGIVNAVAPTPEETLETAKQLAAKISQFPSETIYVIKKLTGMAMEGYSFQEGVEYEIENFGKIFKTAGALEGINSFLEKRPANYQEL